MKGYIVLVYQLGLYSYEANGGSLSPAGVFVPRLNRDLDIKCHCVIENGFENTFINDLGEQISLELCTVKYLNISLVNIRYEPIRTLMSNLSYTTQYD